MAAHVGHLLVEGILQCLNTALQLLSLEVVLFHVCDELPQLLREFLLVLGNLTKLCNSSLIHFVDTYLVASDER